MFNFILSFFLALTFVWMPLVSAREQPTHTQAWVVDTDVGPDDALALLFILKQPRIKVEAITIEGDGNAHCLPAFANVQGLLQLVEQQEIPVACGRPTPLRGKHQFPPTILASGDSLANTPLNKPQASLPKQSAKDLLIKTLSSASQPVNILALGPLTTLAEVFEERPELKNKIQMIYLMGGAIKVPGNIKEVEPRSLNLTAEWNIYIDPYAAEKVFQSGLPLTLVPLDATNQALIDQHFYEELEKKHRTPAASFAYNLFKHNKKMLLDKAWFFWDPMAAVIATDESLANITVLPLSVRQAPEALAGTTIIDNKKGVKLRVCTGIKVEEFKKRLLQGLNSEA